MIPRKGIPDPRKTTAVFQISPMYGIRDLEHSCSPHHTGRQLSMLPILGIGELEGVPHG